MFLSNISNVLRNGGSKTTLYHQARFRSKSLARANRVLGKFFFKNYHGYNFLDHQFMFFLGNLLDILKLSDVKINQFGSVVHR